MMAQPLQFRPGPPGAPPPGPPGAPGMPPGPPGGPRVSTPMGMMPGTMPPPTQAYPQPTRASFDSMGDGGKKGKKGKKKKYDSDDEEEEDCKCTPQQPATQIFICPPSCQPQGMGGMMGGCPDMGGMGQGYGGNGFGHGHRGSEHSSNQMSSQNCIDPAKLCQIQCYGGGKNEDTQTQVICCPPSSCSGCQKKSQQQQRQQKKQQCVCQCCGTECPPQKSKKPQAGCVESMMPASQQFLMFLQAYGLAAALIRDRNRREEERAQKEFEEKKKGSQSSERKGSAKGKDKDKGKKDKGKKK